MIKMLYILQNDVVLCCIVRTNQMYIYIFSILFFSNALPVINKNCIHYRHHSFSWLSPFLRPLSVVLIMSQFLCAIIFHLELENNVHTHVFHTPRPRWGYHMWLLVNRDCCIRRMDELRHTSWPNSGSIIPLAWLSAICILLYWPYNGSFCHGMWYNYHA